MAATLLKQLFLFGFLAIYADCGGQQKTNTPTAQDLARPSPVIIRNFPTVAVAPDFDTTLVSQYIRSIFQDSKDNLWFGTLGEGVVRYDAKTLTYFSNIDGFYNNTVYAINEDKEGNLWFGTDQGIYKYDGKTFRNYSGKDGLAHRDITRKGILVDKSGTLWVGTHRGVFIYDPTAESKGDSAFSAFKHLPPADIAGIMEDKKGNIWFATANKGVFKYDGKSTIHLSEKEGLGQNYAGGMAEDRGGNIWFTMKNGISKYDGTSFTDYTSRDGLSGTEFWGVCIEDPGVIWVTARGSTTRFDPSIPLPGLKAFTVFRPADGLNCCVQSMYQDKSGNMWWGTGQGLYRFDGTRFYQVKKNGPW